MSLIYGEGGMGNGVRTSYNEGVFTVSSTSGSVSIDDYSSSQTSNFESWMGPITKIVISQGITRIGNYAFAGSQNLESIEISDTVTSIGDNTFAGCPKLKSIVFSASSTLTSIGDKTFYGCEALENVVLPEGLTTIGVEAFSTTAIKFLTIPSTVTSIGTDAFSRLSYPEHLVQYRKFKINCSLNVFKNKSIFYGLEGSGTDIELTISSLDGSLKSFFNTTRSNFSWYSAGESGSVVQQLSRLGIHSGNLSGYISLKSDGSIDYSNLTYNGKPIKGTTTATSYEFIKEAVFKNTELSDLVIGNISLFELNSKVNKIYNALIKEGIISE